MSSRTSTQFEQYYRDLDPAEREALQWIVQECAREGYQGLPREYLRLAFKEPVPPMDEFLMSKKYLGLSRAIYPRIFDMLMYFDEPAVREMTIAAGKGGGKSFFLGCAGARAVNILLSFRDPYLAFGLAPGSGIYLINASLSGKQAGDVVFREFGARIENSPWFRKQGFTLQKRQCRFPAGVMAISGTSNAAAMHGYNTFMGVMDEVSYMDTTASAARYASDDPYDDQHSLAERLRTALLGSLESRFPNHYKFVQISSPRDISDPLWRDVREIKEEGVRFVLPSKHAESKVRWSEK